MEFILVHLKIYPLVLFMELLKKLFWITLKNVLSILYTMLSNLLTMKFLNRKSRYEDFTRIQEWQR